MKSMKLWAAYAWCRSAEFMTTTEIPTPMHDAAAVNIKSLILELGLKGIQVCRRHPRRVAAPQPADQARAAVRLGRRPPSARSSSPRSSPGCSNASRPSSASATPRPHIAGILMAVDTFFVGTLKGVEKIYLQTAIDCHSRYAWARLYQHLPVTAVHLMNNDVSRPSRPTSPRSMPSCSISSSCS